ncbi:hypothetical protein COLU111180_02375 [Cohnella lubricantis]|uniref:Uncharacterized protein n=1 Tax=Cohnella lubricantis TaxID=2163172 RepID=A0A841TI98_9BACL|nr:hypothetical protein [Cohnella lubricantis]MBB6678968.1 hypothetical protein [Cohnella lubricantis]MBP2118812.1 hypothetical protein [Cohnella lubricantis]
MINRLGLQRRVLFVLIACYLAGVILAGLLFAGFYLWNNMNDRPSMTSISASEIGSSLHYKGKAVLPAWGIERAALYDDHFASPHVTVEFANGVAVEVSKSQFAVSGNDEFVVKKGGLTYHYILPERMTESEIAALKEEVTP